MAKTALIVGGTGPTGPYIASGLEARGYTVTLLHRGTHELPELMHHEHIHVDPHFLETLQAGLEGRRFDLVVATYGRMRLVAEALAGKTERFVAVGGFAPYRGFEYPHALIPSGLPVPTRENHPLVASEQEHRFSYLIAQAEAAVFQHHPNATMFRYPLIYGPRQLVPREWSLVRRIVDKRPHLILPDGGLAVLTSMFNENAAHALLLAIDQPDVSAGQIYNVGDDIQLTVRQLAETVARLMGHEWEYISMPSAGPVAKLSFMHLPRHIHMDTFKLRSELGYRDLVPVDEAMRRTVQWLLENPVERGGDTERRMPDTFDYRAEDELVQLAKESAERIDRVEIEQAPYIHAYAHPKTQGAVDHHRR